MENAIKRWNSQVQAFFDWQHEASFIEKIALSFLFALFTGISAQVVIRLPFTPVPVTGQVFVVLLSSILIGKNMSCLSQIFYICAGITRVPWFSGGQSGFFLPTFGYIVGFIPAAFFVGYFFERRKNYSLTNLVFLMLLGVMIIYLFGSLWFSFFTESGLKKTFLLAVAPFVPFDIFKAYFAAFIAKMFYIQILDDGNLKREV